MGHYDSYDNAELRKLAREKREKADRLSAEVEVLRSESARAYERTVADWLASNPKLKRRYDKESRPRRSQYAPRFDRGWFISSNNGPERESGSIELMRRMLEEAIALKEEAREIDAVIHMRGI